MFHCLCDLLCRSDYPPWLWRLLQSRSTLEDLRKKQVTSSNTAIAIREKEALDNKEYMRYKKLKRRASIKSTNGAE